METIYEQIEYGNTCVHGTSVGTPGGADLMCGDCEAGYTVLTYCTSCGVRLWLTHEQVLVSCEPNAARASLARDMRQARDEGLGRSLLLRVIADWKAREPRRVHDIRTNIGERV